jgi:antitoxin VapB
MIHGVINATQDEIVALNIRNRHTEELAAALAALTGESKTQAVTKALQERLEKMRRTRRKRSLADELGEIAAHCASLPVLDARPASEILGYDAAGLPR